MPIRGQLTATIDRESIDGSSSQAVITSPVPEKCHFVSSPASSRLQLAISHSALMAQLSALLGERVSAPLHFALVPLGLTNAATIVLAVILAFLFGYAFTMVPLLKAGLAFGAVLRLALAADTVSITITEIVDNAIMLLILGAMDAGLDTVLFWASLAFALLIAGLAVFPVNRWLIARGSGHAVIHQHHH